MAIRVSGLISGLDTDSLVQELVSAYSTKKDKYVKSQTKLEWKMDAWKDLNKKVNSLYKKLGNLKLSTAYNKKTTTCSDTTKATVSASNGAIDGTQSLKINKVAKTGYITGAQLDSSVSTSTKLSELGVTGDASIAVTTKSGTKNITLTDDMTVNDVVSKLKDAGISANYDAVNKRMFISAKESGVENDFALTATDANGVAALQGLGIYVNKSANTDAYEAWAAYENTTDDELAAILDTIQTYQGDASTAGSIAELQQDSANRKTENTNLLSKISYANNYRELKEALKAGTTRVDVDGNPVLDADGNEIVDQNLTAAEQQELADLLTKQDDLTDDEKTRLDELKGQLGADDETWKKIEGYASTVKKFEAEDDNAADKTLVRDAYDMGGAADIQNVTDGWTAQMEANNSQITANTEAIADKNAYIQKYALLTGAAPASDTTTTAERVAVLRDKINFAVDQINNPSDYSNDPNDPKGAKLVAAQDAEIELNGATYTSASNNITVNGLTITALQETNGEEISITTSANVQGMYDTIKDFLKQYNELIKEMDTLYNADSAKGYEPLTDDEKDAMTDTEIEKWEKKIKDSILRRDDTLSSVMSLMTTAMSKSFTLSNGKTYSLSSFGIKTQGYFAAEENEGSVFHIDGDPDDELTSGNADKLMTALQEDPDSVQEFFQQLTGNFYKVLNDKMGTSTKNHSIYTIYNDKTMQTEYDEYTKTIKKWEDKVASMEEYYYNKFSAMETALSKLQSQTSALSGLLGTS